ncbi:MAG: nitroreductase family protein [Eubacterium sp.]|nr:nitroreductase family protein [Eubacterium sp.]
MKVIEAINNRRSYRGKFKDISISREDLTEILRAGVAAPSGCNKQTTSLIAIDDPEVLKELKAVIDPPVAETAPAAICVLTQGINAYRDKCFAVQDYSAAIENMLLVIEEMGYASCWYEGHITDDDKINEKMAKVLGVPDGYELVCFLPVGVPECTAVMPKKKAFEERVWFNHFGEGN